MAFNSSRTRMEISSIRSRTLCTKSPSEKELIQMMLHFLGIREALHHPSQSDQGMKNNHKILNHKRPSLQGKV